MRKRIICISGYARHGKDTLALALQQATGHLLPTRRYIIVNSVQRLQADFLLAVQTANYTADELQDIMVGSRKNDPLPCLNGACYRDWMRRKVQSASPCQRITRELLYLKKFGNSLVLSGVRWRNMPVLIQSNFERAGWEVLFVWVERPNIAKLREEVEVPTMFKSRGWYDIRVSNRSSPAAMVAQLRAKAPGFFR